LIISNFQTQSNEETKPVTGQQVGNENGDVDPEMAAGKIFDFA
jgi:hypothetical protein